MFRFGILTGSVRLYLTHTLSELSAFRSLLVSRVGIIVVPVVNILKPCLYPTPAELNPPTSTLLCHRVEADEFDSPTGMQVGHLHEC